MVVKGAGLLVVVELVAVDGAPLVVVKVVVKGAGLLVALSWLLLMEPH